MAITQQEGEDPGALAAAHAVPSPLAFAGLAEGSQIVASKETAAGSRFPVSNAQAVTLRGTSEPVDVVTVEWH